MPRKERPLSPDTAIDVENSSIPNLPQGACLAQEDGGIGGGTSGSARERAACGERSRTGSPPNKSSPPAQRSLFSERGYGASQPPCLRFLLFPKSNQRRNQQAHSFQQKRRT